MGGASTHRPHRGRAANQQPSRLPDGRLSSSVCEASGGQIYGVDFAALREQGDILWQMLKAFCHMPWSCNICFDFYTIFLLQDRILSYTLAANLKGVETPGKKKTLILTKTI